MLQGCNASTLTLQVVTQNRPEGTALYDVTVFLWRTFFAVAMGVRWARL